MKKLLLVAAIMAYSAVAFAQQGLTVYKSPTCGCCAKWVEHLQSEGFKVKVIETADMQVVKLKHGVTAEQSSCHTATVDGTGYVIEGHVPAAAITKLLAESPKTQGLTVPGMPMNSPGMGKLDGTLKTMTFEGEVFSVD